MKLLFFILFMIPLISYSQITVIEVTQQRNMFEEKVISEGWPKWNKNSWYGNPDSGLDFAGIGYDAFWNQPKGERTFYTNISENQRIFLGDSINLISGGGENYVWNTGDSTRVIKVSPIDTTTYTVTIKDDDRTDEKSVIVYVEPRPDGFQTINIGNDYSICEGLTITLVANGLSQSTYLWSTGDTSKTITVTPSLTQFYTVSVTLGNQTVTDTILIIVNNCN